MKPKILSTLPGYSLSAFRGDVIAGITVAMVALPLSLAIAIASGATPDKGIVTAIVAGFLISAFGGSRVQIGGPTGAFIVVVYGIIASHGYSGLVLATLMAGAILMIGAMFRLGSLIAFVPEPVVNGFTIGIAIIIAASQIIDLAGITAGNAPADFVEKIAFIMAHVDQVNPVSLGIGIGTVAAIFALRRLAPRFPGLIIAVVLASALAAYGQWGVATIHGRFGDLPGGLPVPALPQWSLALCIDLLPSALIIAFLAAVESLLSALVADKMIAGAHRPNAEVLAQGIANIGSSLFGGMPATGAIARTATNVRAGATTPVAGIIHAIAIAVVMAFAAPLVGHIAMPALAGVLIVTAWTMSEPHHWPNYLRAGRGDVLLLLTTLILTVFADLTIAIGVGVALGLAMRLRDRTNDPEEWSTPDR